VIQNPQVISGAARTRHNIEHKMCDSVLSTTSFGNESHADKYLTMFDLGTDIDVGLYAKYLLFMSDFN
jgi:hypothetical protein